MNESFARLRIGFIVEQALGHRTHAGNLQQAITGDSELEPVWGLIPYEVGGWAARIPLFRSNWTVRAGLRARRQLASMARGGRLRSLFIHTQVPAVLVPDWVRSVPTVVSLDATPLQYDELGAVYAHTTGPARLERVKWRLNRAVFDGARHLVTWSRWTRNGLAEGYGVDPKRVTVIPPGVHTRDWTRPEVRRDHGGPVRVLFVGGDAERKGGLLLLEAVRALREEFSLEVDIVTGSPLRAEPGVRVHTGLAPNTDELRRLYHEADVFCLPTEGDCMPLALAEAAASGLPSVSTSVAAIPEIVRDGETGILVAPRDRRGLIEALRQLVTDPARRLAMGAAAEALAVAEHDAGRNACRLLELLKRAAGHGPGSAASKREGSEGSDHARG
jgi:glycosyltransferase involved in cell wall biosynthesis